MPQTQPTNSQPNDSAPDAVPKWANTPAYGHLVTQLALWSALVAVVFGVAGWFVAQSNGLVSGLVGAGLTLIFCGSTALIMGLTKDKSVTVQSAWLVGAWALKMVLLLAAMVALSGADFYHKTWFGVTVLIGLLGSIGLDFRLVLRTRQTTGA